MMQQRASYGPPQPSSGSQWDRRDPNGYGRMLIVFVGAAVGAFFIWPMIRPVFIASDRSADRRPAYSEQARGYAPQQAPAGYQGRRGYDR
jgi:hypothetical protein